jgi:hypothetical protein
MSKAIELASGQFTTSPHNMITVELIEPVGGHAEVRVIWPSQATVTTPARYAEVAATAMRILVNASTEIARIKAGTRRD